MKLGEGIYVRTKYGITQYKEYETSKGKLLCMPLMNGTFANIEDVQKASYDILDLIRVGDYVNGFRVIRTNCKLEYYDDYYENGVDTIYDAIELEHGWIYFEHEIESIVTKEQFESMVYKVVE